VWGPLRPQNSHWTAWRWPPCRPSRSSRPVLCPCPNRSGQGCRSFWRPRPARPSGTPRSCAGPCAFFAIVSVLGPRHYSLPMRCLWRQTGSERLSLEKPRRGRQARQGPRPRPPRTSLSTRPRKRLAARCDGICAPKMGSRSWSPSSATAAAYRRPTRSVCSPPGRCWAWRRSLPSPRSWRRCGSVFYSRR